MPVLATSRAAPSVGHARNLPHSCAHRKTVVFLLTPAPAARTLSVGRSNGARPDAEAKMGDAEQAILLVMPDAMTPGEKAKAEECGLRVIECKEPERARFYVNSVALAKA